MTYPARILETVQATLTRDQLQTMYNALGREAQHAEDRRQEWLMKRSSDASYERNQDCNACAARYQDIAREANEVRAFILSLFDKL
jgi:hypothetical protein